MRNEDDEEGKDENEDRDKVAMGKEIVGGGEVKVEVDGLRICDADGLQITGPRICRQISL